jgi:hypothetical protein
MYLSGPGEVTSCPWLRWLDPALEELHERVRTLPFREEHPWRPRRPDKQTCAAAKGWT